MASFSQQMNNLWVQQYPPGGNVSANAGSDSHVTGFGGQRYQCQPKTDALYFRNLAAEFEMHGRHEGSDSKLKIPNQISAIAIRVRSQRIEYNMQGRNFMDPKNNGFLIDGRATQLTDKGLFLAESETSIVLENTETFHVYTATGIKVTVYNCGGSNLKVTLTIPRSIAQNAEPSLFGNLTGAYGQIIRASGIFSTSLVTASVNYGLHNIPSNARWSTKGDVIIEGLSNYPAGLAIDQQSGTVFVADYSNNRIVSWTPGQQGTSEVVKNLSRPTDVLIDKDNNSLIIADCGNGRVIRFSLQSNNTQIETIIDNIDCFGLATDDEGALYVTDDSKHEVSRYPEGNKTGEIVAGGYGKGAGLRQLDTPRYVTVDSEGAVYVSDRSNCRVVKWNRGATQGIVVAGLGGAGSKNTQLNSPYDVLIDANDNLYIADTSNHRVVRYRKNATTADIIVDQLNYPYALAFDNANNIYVADRSARVLRFNITN